MLLALRISANERSIAVRSAGKRPRERALDRRPIRRQTSDDRGGSRGWPQCSMHSSRPWSPLGWPTHATAVFLGPYFCDRPPASRRAAGTSLRLPVAIGGAIGRIWHGRDPRHPRHDFPGRTAPPRQGGPERHFKAKSSILTRSRAGGFRLDAHIPRYPALWRLEGRPYPNRCSKAVIRVQDETQAAHRMTLFAFFFDPSPQPNAGVPLVFTCGTRDLRIPMAGSFC